MIDETQYRIPEHARRHYAFLVREGAGYVLYYRDLSYTWAWTKPSLLECNEVLRSWNFPEHRWYEIPLDWAEAGHDAPEGVFAQPADDEQWTSESPLKEARPLGTPDPEGRIWVTTNSVRELFTHLRVRLNRVEQALPSGRVLDPVGELACAAALLEDVASEIRGARVRIEEARDCGEDPSFHVVQQYG